MTEVSLLSLSPSSSSASSFAISPNTKPTQGKNWLNLTSQDDEIDEMYNSLRRLSNSTAMSTTRLRKITPSPIPFRDIKKNLTFTLNEIYFTDGQSQQAALGQEETSIKKMGVKKNLYNK